MEFTVFIEKTEFIFSQIGTSSFFVSGSNKCMVLHKSISTWRCEEDVPSVLVDQLGRIIEKHAGMYSA
jgi:hypothetical protein